MTAFISALILFLLASNPSLAESQSLYHQTVAGYRPVLSDYGPLPQLTPESPAAPSEIVYSPPPSVLGVTQSASPSIPLPAIGGDPGMPGDRPFTVALLGDSMIDTLGPNLPALSTALQKYYPNRQIRFINYGVGASHLEYALYRLSHDYDYLDNHYPSLISQKPDLLILESFAYNNFGNSQSALDRYRRDLDLMTAAITRELPAAKLLLVATIAPNSVTFTNGLDGLRFSSLEKIDQTNTIKLYLQNFIDYASSRSLPLADAYHPSLINNDGNPVYINPSDNIHPSPKGAALFSETVAKAIFNHHLIL